MSKNFLNFSGLKPGRLEFVISHLYVSIHIERRPVISLEENNSILD